MRMKFSPLKSFFPTADEVLAADQDRLDETLLRHLKTYEAGGTVGQSSGFHRDYYIRVMEGNARGLGPLPTQPEYGDRQPQVSRRMRESWNSAVLKGYLMQNSEQPNSDWFVFTSAGEEVINRAQRGPSLPSDIVARMLPQQILNPKISDKPWRDFMRGDFGTAAFEAMKAVEVSVRAAGGFGNDLVGVALMRQAFAYDKGPLTDTAVERGEQVARMELFAGAIGSYKNPHSHRDVNLNDPVEAAEIILVANHLLRLVDARQGKGKDAMRHGEQFGIGPPARNENG